MPYCIAVLRLAPTDGVLESFVGRQNAKDLTIYVIDRGREEE